MKTDLKITFPHDYMHRASDSFTPLVAPNPVENTALFPYLIADTFPGATKERNAT